MDTLYDNIHINHRKYFPGFTYFILYTAVSITSQFIIIIVTVIGRQAI